MHLGILASHIHLKVYALWIPMHFFYVLFCSLLPVLFIFQFYFLRYFYLFKVTPKLYIPSTLNIDLIFPNIPQKVKTRFIFIQFLFHFSSKATAVAWRVAGSWLSLDFQLPLDIKSYFSIFLLFFLAYSIAFQPFSGLHIYSSTITDIK